VPYLKDYILQGVLERFNKMYDLLRDVFANCRIQINKSYLLKKLELGLLTKSNVNEAIKLTPLPNPLIPSTKFMVFKTAITQKIVKKALKIKIPLNFI
jgi:hypothetical protein